MVESLDNIQTRLLIFEIWETLIPSKMKKAKVWRNAAGSSDPKFKGLNSAAAGSGRKLLKDINKFNNFPFSLFLVKLNFKNVMA